MARNTMTSPWYSASTTARNCSIKLLLKSANGEPSYLPLITTPESFLIHTRLYHGVALEKLKGRIMP
jgi:hypothetical protein